ncbi:hypothetical protein TcWFU_005669 [Taenia crassiceps]|uniref:Uncharacterized protein n=1 Tax=Taenia crassiceps TaxID=6207 RepID=A0ABR4QLJ6_9CEST
MLEPLQNFVDEHSAALNFETQREVDTILASNISVTDFLEALIAEPQIRYLWVPVQGKSGNFYRLRICDTELALCKDDGSDATIHVWPWQEVGEPKYRKTEVRMPWLITDERFHISARLGLLHRAQRPQLTPILADVLQSTRPENLNDSKRRKLSRADSIPPPIVLDAKYHFTITVFVKDINASSKLVYQITCIRAMAFANGTQPAAEPEDNSFRGSSLNTSNQMPKGKMQKKKGFSLCGLNCMGRKEKEEMDENPDSHLSRRSVDYVQSRPSVAEVATPRNPQVVAPPSPPQRRLSSSIAKQTITEEDDIETPNCSVQPSTDENLVTKIPNVVVCKESYETVLNVTPSQSKSSISVNLPRYPTYTKSDATSQFLNEPQITSACTPQPSQVQQEVKSTLSPLKTNVPKPSHESMPNEVPQLLLFARTQKDETTAPGLTSSKGAENVGDCADRSQPSPVPSPKKREMGMPSSSPARTSTSLHSGIPLPRNPTRAMVGAVHHPPSPSGEFVENEASGHSNEATLELQATATDSTIILEGSVNPDKSKLDSEENVDVGLKDHSSSLPIQESSQPGSRGNVDTDGIINKQVAIMNVRQSEAVIEVHDEDNCSILTHSPMLELSDATSESPSSSPVQEISVITPVTDCDSTTQNRATKADVSPSTPQTQRPSGLISPKVVVNKPGISVYKGRNAPSLSSFVKPGPGGDSPNGCPTTTSTPQVAPTATVVSVKSSNIRPPMVTTEAKVMRHQPRSSIPTRGNPAIRNGHDGPSAGPSQAAAVRSTSTGIRMPSQLSRQTLAK